MYNTELDYYNILNVPRSAAKEDIAIAYRKLALKLCPLRRQNARNLQMLAPPVPQEETTHMSPIPLSRQWSYINMAYDILGNELRRSIYDRFGEAGLLKGIFLPNTGYFPPYQYHGNHMQVYSDVFASYSPYADVIDAIVGSPSLPLYTTKSNGIGVKTKDPPVLKHVGLDLEEVYKGCTKLMHVWRQEFSEKDYTNIKKRKKTLTLNIPPGVTAGTHFCFQEQGDRYPTTIPSDIIFVVDDKPHDRFKRCHLHDLIYNHEIALLQALTGFKLTIPHLDKRELKISVTDVVYPGYKKIIPGEGLPKCKSNGLSRFPPTGMNGNPSSDFGDLIIEFNIVFPLYLNADMKALTRNFFADLNAMMEEENPGRKCIKKN